MSSSLYELEENPKNGHEVGDQLNKQNEEDGPEDELATSSASHNEFQDAQQDDESLEIVGETNKAAPSKTPASLQKDKVVVSELVQKAAQFKRPPPSRSPRTLGEDEIPTKRVKRNPTTVHEAIVETHQPSPNEEWGIDMDKCLDVFNMDVGEEYEEKSANEQVGESSTYP